MATDSQDADWSYHIPILLKMDQIEAYRDESGLENGLVRLEQSATGHYLRAEQTNT